VVTPLTGRENSRLEPKTRHAGAYMLHHGPTNVVLPCNPCAIESMNL